MTEQWMHLPKQPYVLSPQQRDSVTNKRAETLALYGPIMTDSPRVTSVEQQSNFSPRSCFFGDVFFITER